MAGVRPRMATAFATVGFFALIIAAFGVTSLVVDADVIATPGVGLLPGAIALALATAAFAAVLWRGTHAARPTYRTAGVAMFVVVAVYVVSLGLSAGFGGASVGLAAVGGFVTSWFCAALAACAFVAAWCGIALVRTRARRPRWHWEDDED